MKAIQIKYIGPTNTRGTRVKAFADCGLSVIEPRDYALNYDEQARDVANKLIAKMNWNVSMTGFGQLPNGDYVATLGNDSELRKAAQGMIDSFADCVKTDLELEHFPALNALVKAVQ